MSEELSVFDSPRGKAAVLAAYDRVLRQWTAPYTELDVPTSFGQTHVIASGPEDAPPLVLLHGFFATAAVWFPNVGHLSECYRTFAVDMIGEPNKSRPVKPIAKLDKVVQWLDELLDGLGARQVHLAGNSVGGFFGAYYAMRRPERVRRLVLIGPAATFHQIVPLYVNVFAPKMAFVMFPNVLALRVLIRRSVDWLRSGVPLGPAWGELFYQLLLHGVGASRIFPKVYSEDELRQIKAPTLLLIGDRERIYRPEDSIRVARRYIPNLQTEIVPNAHHITALARPEIVDERIRQFFQED